MTELLLAILLAMPVAWTDRAEASDDRSVRLRMVAAAIARHTDDPIEAALVVSSGYHESRFAGRIGPNGLGDGGKSSGYWQPQRQICPGAWSPDPRVALDAGAECAVRLLGAGYRACRTPGGAFARYNGNRACTPPSWARKRVSTFAWVHRRLVQDLPIPGCASCASRVALLGPESCKVYGHSPARDLPIQGSWVSYAWHGTSI